MREPWRDRRKRLDDLPDGRQLPRSLIHRADRAATKVPSIATLGEIGEGAPGEGAEVAPPRRPLRSGL